MAAVYSRNLENLESSVNLEFLENSGICQGIFELENFISECVWFQLFYICSDYNVLMLLLSALKLVILFTSLCQQMNTNGVGLFFSHHGMLAFIYFWVQVCLILGILFESILSILCGNLIILILWEFLSSVLNKLYYLLMLSEVCMTSAQNLFDMYEFHYKIIIVIYTYIALAIWYYINVVDQCSIH